MERPSPPERAALQSVVNAMNEIVLPKAPGEHPAPEALYRARQRPRSAEAEAILAHAALCATCAEEEMRQEAFDATGESAGMSERRVLEAWSRFGEPARRRRLFVSPALLALAAAIVLGVGASLVLSNRGGKDDLRGAGTAAELSPTGDLEEAPAAFRFPASSRAVSVVVFDASRTYTWTSPAVTNGRVDLPEAERKKLAPGVEYFWTVMGGDRTIPSVTFRIKARSAS